MLNILISIVVFTVSVFLMGVSVRYGLMGAARLDDYFSLRTGRSFYGYNWYYRLPFAAGFIPEYYFYLVIGGVNYFKVNWWPLKTAAFISVLLALATLKSRTAVYQYFSLEMIGQQGILSLFTSGTFTWYLNIITLLYLALFVLITIESIKMHGIYAPVRIAFYSVLCVLMANLTIIVLGLIVFVTLIYIVLKVIGFLFFSGNRHRRRDETVNEQPGWFKRGFAVFRAEVKEWEQESRIPEPESRERKKPKVKRSRKKPVIRRTYNDDIPRLHPD